MKRTGTALLALALGALLVAGCNQDGSSSTLGGGSGGGDGGTSSADTSGSSRTFRDVYESSTSEPARAPKARRGALGSLDINQVAGVNEGKRSLGASEDVLFTLYDVGRGSKVGPSKTIMKFYGESSRRFASLMRRPGTAVVKRVPDDDLRRLVEAAQQGGFMDLLRPMSTGQVDRAVASGEGVITLEQEGQLLGVVRPRIRHGGTEEEMEIYTGMKLTLLRLAQLVTTPIVTGGRGSGHLSAGQLPGASRR